MKLEYQASGSSRQEARYVPVLLLFLMAGVFCIVLPGIRFGAAIPGDLGDSRFNMYVLEHLHCWVAGRVDSFWDAPFFYPWEKVLAFSSNHLGTGLIYSFFRLAGFDRESAFQAWYVAGFITSFAACAHVMRQIGFSAIPAGTGAFLFTFGFPVMAQQGHVQLLYRAGIPFAFLFFREFIQQPRLKVLALAGLAITWQFYAEIYLGFFLALFMAALTVVTCMVEGCGPEESLLYWPRKMQQAWICSSRGERFLYVPLLFASLVSLGVLFRPYVWVSGTYGFMRSWNEIESMLPRISSYLIADHSLVWNRVSLLITDIPMRHEHQLFIGLVPALLLVVAVIRRRDSVRFGTLLPVLALSVLAVVVVTGCFVFDISLYRLMFAVPGGSAIRGVSRVMLVLIFPLSVIVAIALELMQDTSASRPLMRGIFQCAVLLLLLDCCLVRQSSYEKKDGQERLALLRAGITGQVPENPILFVAAWPGESQHLYSELDAMLLAQERGWKTLNGYSGNSPAGYYRADSCSSMDKRIAGYVKFHSLGEAEYTALSSRVVTVGFSDCKKHGRL